MSKGNSKKKIRIRYIAFVLLFVSLSFFSYISSNSSSHIEEVLVSENLLYDELENEVLFDVEEFSSSYAFSHPNETLKLIDNIKRRAKANRFHGSILIAHKDEVVINEQIGYQDPRLKIAPLQPNLSYELASVSKQFTAAAILMLQEEECLDIDEPVANYLPDFKFQQVTIRHLLKHSSGLWDYMYITEAFWKKKYAPGNQDVVELVNKHQRHLNFRVGTRFNYNNTNYVLLAAIVEEITKSSFSEFLQERVFSPLCLEDSYIGIESRQLPNVADAFIGYGRGYVNLPPSFHNEALGDKGVYSSSTDLWRWFKSIKNNELLSEESVNLMFNQDQFNYYKYGMGFRTKKGKHKEKIIYHNGIWDGYRNGLTYLPEHDLVIILLSNTQNKNKKFLQDYLIHQSKQFVREIESASSVYL